MLLVSILLLLASWPQVALGSDDLPSCLFTLQSSNVHIVSNASAGAARDTCTYIVNTVAQSVCQIHFQFHHFPSPEDTCSVVSLVDAPVLDLCGNLTGQNKTLTLSRPASSIRLVLFSTFFYNMTLRQISCSGWVNPAVPIHSARLSTPELPEPNCDVDIFDAEAVIQSPGYPDLYPDNTKCVYSVHAAGPHMCWLLMRFDEFHLETSEVMDECGNDYLQVLEPTGLVQPLRLCGAFTGTKLLPMDTVRRLIFNSNSHGRQTGFSIFLKQLECPEFSSTAAGRTVPPEPSTMPASTPSVPVILETFPLKPSYCSRHFDLSSGPVRLSSPNYPSHYLDDEWCEFHLDLQPRTSMNCWLQIYFHEFKLQDSPGCLKDHLDVHGQKECGSNSGTSRLYPISGQRSIRLVFKTDHHVHGPGFDLTASVAGCAESSSEAITQAYPGGRWSILDEAGHAQGVTKQSLNPALIWIPRPPWQTERPRLPPKKVPSRWSLKSLIHLKMRFMRSIIGAAFSRRTGSKFSSG